MNKRIITGAAVVGFVAIVTGWIHHTKPTYKTASLRSSAVSGNILSKTGIHWHPQLSIYVKGVKQEIPDNIGIGKQYAGSKWYDPMMAMTDFHTHDNSGTLHWEVMEGPVTRDHVTLQAFFDVWGKAFSATQVFDHKNGADGTVKMLVNGQPNNAFEKYQINDKDKIEIRYE